MDHNPLSFLIYVGTIPLLIISFIGYIQHGKREYEYGVDRGDAKSVFMIMGIINGIALILSIFGMTGRALVISGASALLLIIFAKTIAGERLEAEEKILRQKKIYEKISISDGEKKHKRNHSAKKDTGSDWDDFK